MDVKQDTDCTEIKFQVRNIEFIFNCPKKELSSKLEDDLILKAVSKNISSSLFCHTSPFNAIKTIREKYPEDPEQRYQALLKKEAFEAGTVFYNYETPIKILFKIKEPSAVLDDPLVQSMIHGHLSLLNKTIISALSEISHQHQPIAPKGMTYSLLKPIIAYGPIPLDYIRYLAGTVNAQSFRAFIAKHPGILPLIEQLTQKPKPLKDTWPGIQNMQKKESAYQIIQIIEEHMSAFLERNTKTASLKSSP